MELTYYTSGGGSGTDGGDQYTGLDRFGRVIDQRWDRSGTDLERLKYGYDQVGNRVWRQNTVAEAASANQDEYYTEDGLYQIKTLKRGTLTGTPPTGISGTPTWEEDWNFDPLGNWRGSSSAYKTLVSGTTTLDQNRSHSTVNAISGITTTTGTSWTSPVHDAAGNMTTAPKPLPLGLGSAYTLKYDAWNRLVEVKSGSTVVATYAYDGVNRRVTKTTSVTRHYYYDDRWRVVEERVDAATTADLRFVWGTRRWDDLILRDRIYSSTGGSSSSSSAGPTTERLYVMDDLANVTAVVDTTGTVQERYGYNGFGGVRYMTPSFVTRSASIYYWETLFGSYRYDTETGLYQVRHRYFHPLLGRWINRDPIGERGGINLYAYVGNDPVNWIDLLGLEESSPSPGYDFDDPCNPFRSRYQPDQGNQMGPWPKLDLDRLKDQSGDYDPFHLRDPLDTNPNWLTKSPPPKDWPNWLDPLKNLWDKGKGLYNDLKENPPREPLMPEGWYWYPRPISDNPGYHTPGNLLDNSPSGWGIGVWTAW